MSPRATLKIVNRTRWRTDHLRAFAVRARAEVFGDQPKRLVVEFVHTRTRGTSGWAVIGGSRSRIRVPRENVNREWLAQVLKHEFAHNDGARGERWMRRSVQYGTGLGWRETVAWALDLPLDPAAPRVAAKPTGPALLEAKLAAIETRARAWSTKAKRAATALRKLARQRTYYTRKLAAVRGPA